MKLLLLLIIFFQSSLLCFDTIRFSPLPMESAAKTLEIFTPFIDYLEKKSGKKVELVYRTNNEDIITGLINKQIDLAHFGPLPYAEITKTYKKLVPIIQFLEEDGKDHYTCTLFKKKGTSIDLQKIRDKRFALTHKYSTCGYAFIEPILNKYNSSLKNNHFKYIGSHYYAITDVLTGDYDIGGVKTSIFNKLNYLDIEKIEEGEENPALMIVANSATLSTKEIEKIKEVLLSSTKKDRKNWDKKINKIAIEPNINHLLKYKQRVQNIVLQDDNL